MLRRISLGAESGFSLIELLMAMLLMSVGVMALMGTFDHSRKTTSTAEAEGAAVQVAERHLEEISSRPYDQVGLTATPASSLDPNHPSYWVSNSSPASFRWDPANPATAQLVTGGSGTVENDLGTWGLDAGESPTDARLSGRAYAYVTWVDDACATCTAADQANATDYKRVTVSVTADAPSPLTKPVIVSTIVSDPEATSAP